MCYVGSSIDTGRDFVVPIHPVRFSYDERKRGGRKFFRIQLPLQPAIAITVHRGQGGTYEVVGFHALNIFASFGLTFVAISRCTSVQGFTVLAKEPPEGELPMIKNYVHPRLEGPEPAGDSGMPPTMRLVKQSKSR